MIRHADDVWGVPAGAADDGEDFRSAALRELFEETGITLEAEELEDYSDIVVDEIRRHGVFTEMEWHVFATFAATGELVASSEGMPVWVPLSDLDRLLTRPNVREVIERAVTHFSRSVESDV